MRTNHPRGKAKKRDELQLIGGETGMICKFMKRLRLTNNQGHHNCKETPLYSLRWAKQSVTIPRASEDLGQPSLSTSRGINRSNHPGPAVW